jgi:cbb3-type cytochrome oxidase maturation protein
VTIIFLLIAASTIVALIFLAAFTWAVKSGQFEDDHSPAVRILGDHLPKVHPVKATPLQNTTHTSEKKANA